jgi:hypothetical protein
MVKANFKQLYQGNFFQFCFYFLLVLLSSCGGGTEQQCKELSMPYQSGVFESGPDKALLSNYLRASSGYNSSGEKLDPEVKIYVDKSSGINEAFSSALGGGLATSQLTAILNYYNNAKYLSVLTDIKPFELNGSAPANYFGNGANYDPVAKANLRSALKSITANNGLSFFISDCEEFDDAGQEIIADAWAKDDLISWLNKGNSVHFWITDFQKEGTTKHLFFIAFVPAQVISEDKNFAALVNDLNAKNPKHLELSNKNWSVLKPDWPQQSTGLDANLLNEGVFNKATYVRDFNSEPTAYEYIDLAYPIKAEVLTVPGALKGPDFYRGLKVNLSNNQFFDINQVDLDVYEVSNDIENFSKFYQVSQGKPKFITDEKGAKVLDANDPYTCHYDADGKIKAENNYVTAIQDKKLNELFSFNQELFSNTLKSNSSAAELAIKLHPNFNEADASLNSGKEYGNLIRVDFKVKGFNNKSPDLSMFQWNSALKSNKGKVNVGLMESIQQAIVSTKPEGKVIYTLFIKFIKG